MKTGVASWLGKLTQEEWDRWLSCELSLLDELKKRELTVKLLMKSEILSELKKTPKRILQEIEKNRPDLRIGDRDKALKKMAKEKREIKRFLG